MSVYNAQAGGLTAPNLVVAVACFSGSFAQIAAGAWGTPSAQPSFTLASVSPMPLPITLSNSTAQWEFFWLPGLSSLSSSCKFWGDFAIHS